MVRCRICPTHHQNCPPSLHVTSHVHATHATLLLLTPQCRYLYLLKMQLGTITDYSFRTKRLPTLDSDAGILNHTVCFLHFIRRCSVRFYSVAMAASSSCDLTLGLARVPCTCPEASFGRAAARIVTRPASMHAAVIVCLLLTVANAHKGMNREEHGDHHREHHGEHGGREHHMRSSNCNFGDIDLSDAAG